MSADVYLDVAPSRAALDLSLPNAWVETLRIGHLGLVVIATRDADGERASLLGALRLIACARPTLDTALAELIGDLATAHRAALDAMRVAGRRSYEYGTPVAPDDGEDVTVMSGALIRRWLLRYPGHAWRVRVD